MGLGLGVGERVGVGFRGGELGWALDLTVIWVEWGLGLGWELGMGETVEVGFGGGGVRWDGSPLTSQTKCCTQKKTRNRRRESLIPSVR